MRRFFNFARDVKGQPISIDLGRVVAFRHGQDASQGAALGLYLESGEWFVVYDSEERIVFAMNVLTGSEEQ